MKQSKKFRMSRELSTFPIPEHFCYKLLERGITCIDDLRGWEPQELSKECDISLEEATDILHTIFPPCDSENIRASSSFSVNALQLLENDKSLNEVTTFCHKLDEILGGGIPLKRVSEICGCPGTGKTQFCLQVCANVQIPKKFGGLEGEAFYIDTEGSFSVERFVQIANSVVNQFEKNSKEITLEKLLKGVHYYRCTSYIELIARINLLNEFLATNPKVSLIVIDSICFHFRYGFDDSYSRRGKILNEIGQSLLRISIKYNIAVLVTNQMTNRLQDEGDACLVPALGDSWGHSCAVRIVLSWEEQKRKAYLFKSPWRQEDIAYYRISKCGVRDVE